jgi:predicted AAA+ superfamily ATPase
MTLPPKHRLLTDYLLRDAGYYPVVTLTGPRQSGKTTLVQAAFPSHRYLSLETIDQRDFAREDPRGFLAQLDGPVILDEIQHVPDLLSYIQALVDQDPAPGRFVLTGSQNFLSMAKVGQTLAGRCAILNLLPFSRAELENHPQGEPGAPPELYGNLQTDLDLWEILHSGFYPRIHDRGIPPAVWLSDYVQTYVERDVRSLSNIGDLTLFSRFLALCAGRTAQLLNYSSLAADAGIAVDTARRWISVLNTSFIIFLLPPHNQNFNKRLIKTPKLYFYDTGLLATCWASGKPPRYRPIPARRTFRKPRDGRDGQGLPAPSPDPAALLLARPQRTRGGCDHRGSRRVLSGGDQVRPDGGRRHACRPSLVVRPQRPAA